MAISNAPLWHERARRVLVNIELTLLNRYLGKARGGSLTDTVRDAARYLPAYLPLPHPSWRSTGWMGRNPWFETGILPLLRESTPVHWIVPGQRPSDVALTPTGQ